MSKLGVIAAAAGLGLGLVVSLGGCTRHVHHHHRAPVQKKVVVLEKEHDDRSIVIVHERPRAGRYCWQHARHWHCKR